ncbi:MAG: hypothetical protein AAGI38_13410 [Bacteroidota bacterium]
MEAFGRITTAQLCCFLGEGEIERFRNFLLEFFQPPKGLPKGPDYSLTLEHDWFRLKAEQYVLHAAKVPWSWEISLTLFREQMPYDEWLCVQFAEQLAIGVGTQTYCEVPEEIKPQKPGHWHIRFTPGKTKGMAELVNLRNLDAEWVEITQEEPLDLRNFELYQTRLPLKP